MDENIRFHKYDIGSTCYSVAHRALINLLHYDKAPTKIMHKSH